MKTKRVQWIISLSLILLLSLSLGINRTLAQTKTVIVGGATPMVTVAHSLPLLAKYLGYIKKFDVKCKGFKGSTMLFQQAVTGKIHVASIHNTSFITGNVKEKAFNLLAFYNFRPRQTSYLAVLDESPIRSTKDLKGKKIGVSTFASNSVHYLKAMARHEGFQENDITILAVGIGMPAYTALKKGRIDAFCLWDIEYAKAENAGLKLVYFHDPNQQNLPAGAMTATPKWIKENPKIVEEYGQGIAKATVFAMHNPEAAVKIYWKMVPGSKPTGIDEKKAIKETAHVLKSHMVNLDPKPQKLRWGEFNEAAIQAYIDFLNGAGLIAEKPPAKDFFTNQFVKKFNEFKEAEVIKRAKKFKM